MDPKLFDWRNTEITVGCTVVYANYFSSSMFLTEATVVSMKYDEQQLRYQQWRLVVRTTGRYNGHREELPRVVTLTAVDKITVLTAAP